MKKILICTTFREFNGNTNDKIQRLFLDSLKRQTYQNYELIVTSFKEKNVGDVLQEYKIPYNIFSKPDAEYRFSLTDVMVNGINSITGPGKDIIAWSNCDLIFEETFFENIVKNFSPGFCVTSHPHVYFDTISDFKSKSTPHYHYGSLDFLAFDADLFLNKNVKKVIIDYPNVNWGLYEYFMVGFAKIFTRDRLNLWPQMIYKVANDRAANNEDPLYFALSASVNAPIVERFAKDYKLTSYQYSWFLIFRYLPGNLVSRIKWYANLTRLMSLTFVRRMRAAVPSRIRKILKRLIF